MHLAPLKSCHRHLISSSSKEYQEKNRVYRAIIIPTVAAHPSFPTYTHAHTHPRISAVIYPTVRSNTKLKSLQPLLPIPIMPSLPHARRPSIRPLCPYNLELRESFFNMRTCTRSKTRRTISQENTIVSTVISTLSNTMHILLHDFPPTSC